MIPQQIGDLPNNPYTLADWEALRKAQRLLHDVAPLIDRAEKCGIGCSELRNLHYGMSESLNLIQQHFFTPAPIGGNQS